MAVDEKLSWHVKIYAPIRCSGPKRKLLAEKENKKLIN
jgi:hypothetical protein